MLLEASSFGDLTSDKYVDIQKRIDAALQSVNPTDEYRDFTEKHRLVEGQKLIMQADFMINSTDRRRRCQ